MMTYHYGADARETYRETASASVSRLDSAVQGREAHEPLGSVTYSNCTHIAVNPLYPIGLPAECDAQDFVAASEVVGDVSYPQVFGLSCVANSARTAARKGR